MKYIDFNFTYLITEYDWAFWFLPSLAIWHPFKYAFKITIVFLFWEFAIIIWTKKNVIKKSNYGNI